MGRKKEIEAVELEKALWKNSKEARRQNKALGLDTLYVKDGYLVKLDASGEEHRTLADKWEAKYPIVIQSWQNNWEK